MPDEAQDQPFPSLPVVLVGGVGEMTNPITLHGYSYPLAGFDQVLAAEARQGRAVKVAIQHAGGWTVTDESPACTCRIYIGDDEGCPVHGGKEP